VSVEVDVVRLGITTCNAARKSSSFGGQSGLLAYSPRGVHDSPARLP
jgi:hypothetical protein